MLAEDQKVREAYDKLRNEHGFRMVDYKTDAEAASPRVCLQFSERLSRTQSDFSKFVSVDGKDPQNVVAEERQLCIEGLTHGQRYEIKVRSGLPSDVGEVLEKAADMAVYLPDRKPFVHFTGKSYVLPSRGQQGIPVVSVNTNRLAIEVYRIGDRRTRRRAAERRIAAPAFELRRRAIEGAAPAPRSIRARWTSPRSSMKR